jgi:hypothetical protein
MGTSQKSGKKCLNSKEIIVEDPVKMIKFMISEMEDMIVELEVLSGTICLMKFSGFYRKKYVII